MKNHSSQGVTLTELLIAAILIGIVMLGAVSVDFAIRRGRQNMVQTNKISMEIEASMLQMTRDAMATTGDATNGGINYDDDGATTNICFRYDASDDPNSYADDEWTCYSQDASLDILRCTGRASALATDATCPSGSQVMHKNQLDFFDITDNATTGDIESVTFKLESCDDLTQAPNPTTNPCIGIRSTVNPPSLSRDLPT